jgi:hypothetical protein
MAVRDNTKTSKDCSRDNASIAASSIIVPDKLSDRSGLVVLHSDTMPAVVVTLGDVVR